MLLKTAFREIKTSLGRYLAILAIIALGVGFFTGLRVTRTAMISTANHYLKDLAMFDDRILSTLGWTEEDVDAFRKLDGVSAAEGARSADVLCVGEDGSDMVLKAHSLTQQVNRLSLQAGRLPEKADECVVDAWRYDESALGSVIRLSDNNSADTMDTFASREYTVVGVAASPMYINYERGGTALGNGTVAAFVYLLPEGFALDYYTEIDVTLSWLERRLGKPLTQEDVSHKLGLLGFTTSFSGDTMHVTVPSWRSTGDVSIQADIMEEVARMYGYENFEAAPITTSFDGAINQLDKDLERRIKEYLAIRCGLQEIFTYPWMDEQYVNAILQDTTGILSLSTPPSPTEKMIRSSLLPNLCKAVVKNERYFTDFSLFETAQVFRDENYTTPYDEREKLPSQRKHLGAAFVGSDKDITTLFRRAKGVVEAMPRYTHMEDYTLRQVEKPVWADTVVWLNLYLGEEHIGDLALLSKKVSMECGIKNLAVMLLELDMEVSA